MKEGRIRPSLAAIWCSRSQRRWSFNEGGSNSTLVVKPQEIEVSGCERFNEGGSNSTLVVGATTTGGAEMILLQ